MSTVNRNSFALVLVLLVLHEVTTSAADHVDFPLGPKVRVEMFNQLPNGEQLNIHCKSKNDDLGHQVVAPNQKYGFGFRVDFFGTTLFFCGASWRGGRVVFDIYDAERDNWDRCVHYCKWAATAEGIVGFTESSPSTPDMVLPWQKG